MGRNVWPTAIARLGWGLALLAGLWSCSASRTVSMRYVHHLEIPADQRYNNTLFGGISGIDYDSVSNRFFLVSDDRSAQAPARFYTARLPVSGQRLTGLQVDSVTFFTDGTGHTYPKEAIDCESIRWHPPTQTLFVGDEGGNLGKPSIKRFSPTGKLLGTWPLDTGYVATLRPNKSFESLGFSADYKTFTYVPEAPLTTDGPEPDWQQKGLLRLRESPVNDPAGSSERTYLLETIPRNDRLRPRWSGMKTDNGLAEVIELAPGRWLFLERSGASRPDGSYQFMCSVFYGRASGSTIRKKRLFDFATLPAGDRNIEGMTLVRRPNEPPMLLLVSDNNFVANTPTVFYLFQLTF